LRHQPLDSRHPRHWEMNQTSVVDGQTRCHVACQHVDEKTTDILIKSHARRASELSAPHALPSRPNFQPHTPMIFGISGSKSNNRHKKETSFFVSVLLINRHKNKYFLCRLLKTTDTKNMVFFYTDHLK
jgi:hypothetical protein